MRRSRISIEGRRGRLALVLLSLALLLRLLVPAGWMPVETRAGGWAITLCTGSGPMRMSMAGPMTAAMKGIHHGSGSQDHGSGDHPCAFSSLAMPLDEPAPLALDLPHLVARASVANIGIADAIGRGLAAPPPPSTGPPFA